jgi:hypothetical protein
MLFLKNLLPMQKGVPFDPGQEAWIPAWLCGFKTVSNIDHRGPGHPSERGRNRPSAVTGRSSALITTRHSAGWRVRAIGFLSLSGEVRRATGETAGCRGFQWWIVALFGELLLVRVVGLPADWKGDGEVCEKTFVAAREKTIAAKPLVDHVPPAFWFGA